MSEPPSRKAGASVVKLRRILVPVDFRESTVEALRYASTFAREYRATITLLHVVQPDGSHKRRNITRDRLIDELTELGERQLRKLVDVIWGDEITTDIVVAAGKPHRQIVNEAKETRADMIIMASHGPVGAWGLIRRGTTTKVVRNAPCPVLVVRPFERGFAMDGATERCVDC